MEPRLKESIIITVSMIYVIISFCARLTVAPSLVMTITTTPFAPPSLCSGGESALLRVLEVGGHPRIGPVRVLSISNGGFEMRRAWIQCHATPACLCHCCSNVL